MDYKKITEDLRIWRGTPTADRILSEEMAHGERLRVVYYAESLDKGLTEDNAEERASILIEARCVACYTYNVCLLESSGSGPAVQLNTFIESRVRFADASAARSGIYYGMEVSQKKGRQAAIVRDALPRMEQECGRYLMPEELTAEFGRLTGAALSYPSVQFSGANGTALDSFFIRRRWI